MGRSEFDNSSEKTYRDIKSLLFSLFFLAIGFLAVWFSKNYIPLDNNAIYIFLLLAPSIIYLIFSGRIAEIKGGGVIEAKFISIAEQSLLISDDPIPDNYASNVRKQGMNYLEEIIPRLDNSKPIFLIIVVFNEPNVVNYSLKDSLDYIIKLDRFKTFRFVIFVDSNEKLLAFAPKYAILQLLTNPCLGNDFINIMNEGSINKLINYPFVKRDAIRHPTSYLKALEEMIDKEIDALAIVDDKYKPKGIIEREEIISKLLFGLAKK
jgi:hypothetical protein